MSISGISRHSYTFHQFTLFQALSQNLQGMSSFGNVVNTRA